MNSIGTRLKCLYEHFWCIRRFMVIFTNDPQRVDSVLVFSFFLFRYRKLNSLPKKIVRKPIQSLFGFLYPQINYGMIIDHSIIYRYGIRIDYIRFDVSINGYNTRLLWETLSLHASIPYTTFIGSNYFFLVWTNSNKYSNAIQLTYPYFVNVTFSSTFFYAMCIDCPRFFFGSNNRIFMRYAS